MPTTASDLMHWRCPPAKAKQETGSRGSHRFVWSIVGKRAHDQFGGARNAPSGMHQTYIHRPRDNKVTTYLISITTDCKTISDTSVSTNRHLRACRKTAPLPRRRIYGLGADQRLSTMEGGLPTWGYLGHHVTLHYHGISSAHS